MLEVENLTVEFAVRAGIFTAVREVGFSLRKGRTLCLVGESGSGKSVTARALMQLVDAPGRIVAGSILLGGEAAPTSRQLPPRGEAIRAIRGCRIGMIFQEPMSSLSPVHTIGAQIVEVLRLHLKMGRDAGAGPHHRTAAPGRDPRSRAQHRPLHVRVLRRHAAAGDDRHGAGLQSRSS